MKISIITAVFNGEKTIGSTLASIADQDYVDVEHIIVDGASTDATLARIRTGDRRGAKVVSEPDAARTMPSTKACVRRQAMSSAF